MQRSNRLRETGIPDYLKEKLEKARQKKRMIPLYECGDFVNNYKKPPIVKMIEEPTNLYSEFAVLMPDDSMQPDYNPKDILFVSKYSKNENLPHLILFNDQMGFPHCNVRFVFEYKYKPQLHLIAKNDADIFVDINFTKSLGKIIWRSKIN